MEDNSRVVAVGHQTHVVVVGADGERHDEPVHKAQQLPEVRPTHRAGRVQDEHDVRLTTTL